MKSRRTDRSLVIRIFSVFFDLLFWFVCFLWISHSGFDSVLNDHPLEVYLGGRLSRTSDIGAYSKNKRETIEASALIWRLANLIFGIKFPEIKVSSI